MADVVVIGGGAAGMAAAIEAARCGDRVTVLERMDRVGKKILATGNGRCNLRNMDELRYPRGTAFAGRVLALFGAEEQKVFWQHLGLRLRVEDGGRAYPVSGQASSVLDMLRLAMEASGVKVDTGVQAERIRRDKHGFSVQSQDRTYRAQRVIVAGGGCAQPKLGSNGSCYPLLAELGHRIIRPEPVLTQLMTETDKIRGLSGIRVKCAVKVVCQDRVLHEERGEALFSDYGVSGVCVMQCAGYVRPGSMLVMDLLEGMGFQSAEEMTEELLRRKSLWGNVPMEQLMTGLCVSRVASALCLAAGVQWKNRTAGSLTKREARQIAETTGAFTLKVKGLKGFDNAQVTRGGVDCREFNPENMESLLVPGLHAAGEVLDVDGDCGGFNLMFAFGSGILAGRNGR